MRRLALLVAPALISGCGVQLRAAVPEPVVTVGVNAPAPPAAPDATASVTVDAEPVAEGDPEEVQATTEPPDPVYEEQTDSPNPAWAWVPGYWGWNGVDWGWNYGRWAEPPEGRIYVEPYYERVGGNVVYVRGYWGPHDAPRRSYGGDRIRFTAAARPAGYVRGQHTVVEHRAGPAPGSRPGGVYEHATGTARPLPKATTPSHVTASAHENTTARGGTGGHETTKTETKTETKNETKNETGKGTGHETTHETTHETVHETGHGKETTVHETTHETTHETPHGTTTHETTRETVHTGPAPHSEPAHTAPKSGPAPKKK
jgi:hypothetical protein